MPRPRLIADGCVYAEFDLMVQLVFEANSGRIIWKRTDVSPENIPHGPSSSPVVYKKSYYSAT